MYLSNSLSTSIDEWYNAIVVGKSFGTVRWVQFPPSGKRSATIFAPAPLPLVCNLTNTWIIDRDTYLSRFSYQYLVLEMPRRPMNLPVRFYPNKQNLFPKFADCRHIFYFSQKIRQVKRRKAISPDRQNPQSGIYTDTVQMYCLHIHGLHVFWAPLNLDSSGSTSFTHLSNCRIWTLKICQLPNCRHDNLMTWWQLKLQVFKHSICQSYICIPCCEKLLESDVSGPTQLASRTNKSRVPGATWFAHEFGIWGVPKSLSGDFWPSQPQVEPAQLEFLKR